MEHTPRPWIIRGDTMTTGQKIRAARQSLGLNQTQAAQRLGVRQGRWSDIETDKNGLTIALLRRVAKVLGVNAWELI